MPTLGKLERPTLPWNMLAAEEYSLFEVGLPGVGKAALPLSASSAGADRLPRTPVNAPAVGVPSRHPTVGKTCEAGGLLRQVVR